MDTIGIDLAAQEEKTAVCKVRWSSRRAVATRPVMGSAAGDAQLAKIIGDGEWVGVDAPFGWPVDFVKAVSRYSKRAPWPDVDSDRLRYRLTDRLIQKEHGISPLSVSSDRIGVTAWRCARLLSHARSGRPALDRSGRDQIVEVYPAVALKCWGLERRGYKKSGGAAKHKQQRLARARLIDVIEAACPWLRWEDGAREACIDSDDALDSFLCALIARAAAAKATRWPDTVAEREAAAVEGWIHVPLPGTLQGLAPGR